MLRVLLALLLLGNASAFLQPFPSKASFAHSLALHASTGQHELDHVVSTQWLAKHLEDSNLAIVVLRLVCIDIRGEVKKEQAPGADFVATVYEGLHSDYLDAHIPGAVFVDWTKDIASTDENGVPAQLADRDTFLHAMEYRGISDTTRVIVYDNGNSLFATRFWWAMRYYGHDDVHILDGGWAKWLAEDRPVSSHVACPLTLLSEWSSDATTLRPELRSTLDDTFAAAKARVQLIDARAAEQYTGAVSAAARISHVHVAVWLTMTSARTVSALYNRRAKRGGHIPGAVNTPYKSFLRSEQSSDGTSHKVFKGRADMKEVLTAAGVDVPAPALAYCNGGVASTVVMFALHQLGNDNVTNYDGSWNEYGNRDSTNVETGSAPASTAASAAAV
eukprot:16545-Heterococcus_DN1.PRE.2